MAFVIGAACIDIKDQSCTDACPVDCIYEGDRKLYINPVECIECGACEPACPETAIFDERNAPAEQEIWVVDNRDFFDKSLPGRAEPIGNPGGGLALGPIEQDTPHVSSWVTQA
jgi:NAD-dependent dihydropyrimidine dehydrogenase PreA subunit